MTTELPIKFHCPQCGAHLGTSTQLAGKTAKCPQCGTPIKVPTLCEESQATTNVAGDS